tara:strand:+ start:683 stop:904 length:222 start_codon:yes stop_codon:yes gene_type:complete
MSQKFRCRINERELSLIKEGLNRQIFEAKSPFFINQVLLDELSHLVRKVDVMATKYSESKDEINRNMTGGQSI